MSEHQPEVTGGSNEDRSSFNKGLQGMDVPPPAPVQTPADAPAESPAPAPPSDYDG